MKILSIGNSFSQDAQRYLQEIAKKNGSDFKTVNLYIGSCSLNTHYLNILDDKADYRFELNGKKGKIEKVSINWALESDNWDVITLQQVSSSSTSYETYTPYLEFIYEHVKGYCPKAKVYIHQTWAYKEGSDRLKNYGYISTKDMFEDIKRSYNMAAQAINADGIIPCGQAMFNATQLGLEDIHRDSLHASLGSGRYLLALTWYKALTGNDISCDSFSDFDSPISEQERKIIIEAVNSAFQQSHI